MGFFLRENLIFSVVTVVKDDLDGIQLSFMSLESLIYNFDIEWIVIDGSTDDQISDWISKYSYSNIRYVHELDSSLYEAMNKGIKLISTPFALFLNSKDELCNPEILKREVRNLNEFEGLVGSLVKYDKNNKNHITKIKPGITSHFQLKYGLKPISHQSTIYPSKFLFGNPFDLTIGLAADQISILHLIKQYDVRFSREIEIAKFPTGGLGDQQAFASFFKNMFFYRLRNSSASGKIFQLLFFNLIFILKILQFVKNRVIR